MNPVIPTWSVNGFSKPVLMSEMVCKFPRDGPIL